MDDNRLFILLLVWLAALLFVIASRSRRKERGVGLTAAYLLNLSLIHWVAVVLYIIPGYQNNDPRLVETGFEQSLYAMLAFAFGSVALTPFVRSLRVLPHSTYHQPDPNLPRAYIGIGVVAFMLLSTVGSLPSVTAIVATGQQLIVVGLGLCCWQAWRNRNYQLFATWLGITILLPFVTIVTRGFIGYGAVATLTVLLFVSSFVRTRLIVVLTGLAVSYLGLSFYVTYMRDRGEIREAVWGGQSLQDRIGRVAATVETFEWFDPSNNDHLARVDDRLNQSVLVGAAVTRLSDIGGFARGATLWEALLAMVPRVLWPDKPFTAGSGNMVTEYTGIPFAAGTSVGIGQVMEFYVNFGTLGVIVGFLIMGVVVTILDLMASERLHTGDLHGFVLLYLPGISLLQVGGSIGEMTSSAAASLVVAFLANKYLDRLQNKHKLIRPALPGPIRTRIA